MAEASLVPTSRTPIIDGRIIKEGDVVIHGVEIKLHTVQVEDMDIGRFFIHDTLDDEESDLHYLFKDVDSLWNGTFFSLGFSKHIGIDGCSNGISLDPDEFPGCVIRIDYEPQVALIKGEVQEIWQ